MDIHVEHNHSRMSERLLDTFFKVETTHWWWVGRKNIIKIFLKKRFNSKKITILDAGCGTGSNIIFFNQFGKTYGIDISPIATKFCKKRGIKNITTCDVSKLPYKDSYFDLVSCMDVLEHIEDEKKAISEIYRVLKPGGYVLLTVPALSFVFSKHDKAQGHFRRYSKKYLREILTSVGFVEDRTTYFNTLLSFPIILIRLLSKLEPFSKLADFDAKLNYDIYKVHALNNLLIYIFSLESKILKKIDLPIGISILASYRKQQKSKLKSK
jgi:ubiquinone/menaquinone biosynthesis C-methylase UbiE